MSDKRFNNENLKAAIEKSRMTREQIAAKVGCDTSSITKYYNGDRYPKTDIIIKLAELFNISTDYLLGVTQIETTLKADDNAALRTSCDYTGLDEETAKMLNNLKSFNVFFNEQISNDNTVPDDFTMFSSVLVHDFGFINSFIRWLLDEDLRNNISRVIESANKFINENNFNKFDGNESAASSYIGCLLTNLNGTLYTINHSFNEFIDNYYNLKGIKKQLNDFQNCFTFKQLTENRNQSEHLNQLYQEILKDLNNDTGNNNEQ